MVRYQRPSVLLPMAPCVDNEEQILGRFVAPLCTCVHLCARRAEPTDATQLGPPKLAMLEAMPSRAPGLPARPMLWLAGLVETRPGALDEPASLCSWIEAHLPPAGAGFIRLVCVVEGRDVR